MARALTITAIDTSDGIRVRVGKSTRIFRDQAHLTEHVRSVLQSADSDGGNEILLCLGLAKYLQAGNLAGAVGRTITCDLTLASNIVRVT